MAMEFRQRHSPVRTYHPAADWTHHEFECMIDAIAVSHLTPTNASFLGFRQIFFNQELANQSVSQSISPSENERNLVMMSYNGKAGRQDFKITARFVQSTSFLYGILM